MELLNIGAMLTAHARLFPNKAGARDLERSLTFSQWNARACQLANALLGLGLRKGERVGVLAYNCLEWAEIYAATAKAGLVAVPINFRLTAREAAFIAENAGASALIVQDELAGVVEEMDGGISIPKDRIICFGNSRQTGFRDYEDLLSRGSAREPDQQHSLSDPWTLMYTSGTTGNPKGAIRSHRGSAAMALVTSIELSLQREDGALLVMPMCHANSLYFFGAFAYCGATTTIYSRKSFDPEECVRTLAQSGTTFTSLVPTHYIMMLALSEQIKARHDVSRVAKLMISSAPARAETKRAVMEMFGNSGLFELYGSTETGWVTMLHPHEQFDKLGSVGRECIGSAPIKILNEDGEEVPDGEAGELYSCNPYTFDGYWNLPQKTKEAFRGDYCTVGDMARRDEDGYIRLVDRKSNMIISGGENVYPSEVEAALGAHPQVKDVAVIGVPHEKWGESVFAVVVPHQGATLTHEDLATWVKTRLAGYKRPRAFVLIEDTQMPRNATGKILHRELKTRYADVKT
ncbi:MAG: class I adenylate-forming enzyme family protein [Hyphomicrobiaceae bacterium]